MIGILAVVALLLVADAVREWWDMQRPPVRPCAWSEAGHRPGRPRILHRPAERVAQHVPGTTDAEIIERFVESLR